MIEYYVLFVCVLRRCLDCSPSGSSVHGIFQARIWEWVSISSSRGASWPRNLTQVSCISCIGRILYRCATWILLNRKMERNGTICRDMGIPRECHTEWSKWKREKQILYVVVVQSLGCVWLFATPWTAARWASLSLTVSWVCSNSCPLSQRCYLIFCILTYICGI